jgi:ribosomal protein S18 acetylase RimI-like enzyme
MKGQLRVLNQDNMTKEVLSALLVLGNQTGMWKAPDINYFKEQFRKPDSINVVYEEGEVILGHILARPHNDAVSDYHEEDPLMVSSEIPMYYVEHLVVDTSLSGQNLGMRLITKMIEEANKKRVFHFSIHCRKTNGLSAIIQRRFRRGVQKKREIEHYIDCNGEPFDYLEVEVQI